MAQSRRKAIFRRALRLTQDGKHPLYLFSLTGDEILSVADISRITRDDGGKLLGYQRPEVKRHIHAIVEYLNSDSVLFPNSIILALSSRVKFRESRGPKVDDGVVVAGVLEIPVPHNGDHRPGWIVDGQQRVIALSRSKRKDLPVPISAFVGDDIELQRDQFLRVNNTKPLPRGLITELLPAVSSPLPQNLSARKVPAAICDLLNRDKNSPFYRLIRRTSTPVKERKRAVVADSSVVSLIQESLSSTSGCLFPYRNMATGETDYDGMWAVLLTYWTAVKKTFPEAWGKPPKQSRLMHGAGLKAMGRLMDRIMATINPRQPGAVHKVMDDLERIAPLCHWTSGRWHELDDLNWNELQNVPRHIRILSNLLARTFMQSKGAPA